MLRLLIGLLAATAIAVPTAMSRVPEERPEAPCPTAGALVVYLVSSGVAYKDNLVIAPDGRAALCWGRARPGAVTGRSTFTVPMPALTSLQSQLDGIDVEHLGPAPDNWPPCCLKRATALVYKGFVLPFHGRPRTTSGVQSLHRAEAMLERLIDRHAPEL